MYLNFEIEIVNLINVEMKHAHTVFSLSGHELVGMCGKPKFGSDSVLKKTNRHRTVQKFDIRSDGFSTETVQIRNLC